MEMPSDEVVKLLGVDIDAKLSFNNHICDLCKQAARSLNVLQCIRNVLGIAVVD